MSPCSPNDVNIPIPKGPSGHAIPGFGIPFSPLSLPNISPFPDGFPEDLSDLINTLQLLIPPGVLKPTLNPNFSKDVFDGIMSLLEQFLPFLMLYKFFLPILNIIICIIEVLCALLNPFKLPGAISRLFSVCIPEFLNLFPIFALVIMIISLLLLILAFIEYLISQILKFVEALLRNINALVKAFQDGSATAVLAIATKLGALLCIFQNLFVLLTIFTLIIQVFKDILSKLFSIPPCDDGSNGNPDKCCTPDVCPAIIKNGPYTRTTGTLQYLSQVGLETTGFTGIPAAFLPFFGSLSNLRNESWQLFDTQQTQQEEFINITHAYDVPSNTNPFPIFFPTDANYSATTEPSQVAYTVNLRFFYDPIFWGRVDPLGPRYVQINNCVMLQTPTTNLTNYDTSTSTISNGVASIAGGMGYEDDGVTVLTGYASDGVTPISAQATLNNFLHKASESLPNGATPPPSTYPQAIDLVDLQYTFTPNLPVLLSKNLVTLGCMPDVALNRTFVNTVVAGNIGLNTALLNNLINGTGTNSNGVPNVFPDPNAAQECLSTALSALRTNMTVAGVAEFQATSSLCLAKLQADTTSALNNAIAIGVNPCTSTFSLNTDTQFTSIPIIVSVTLNENSGSNVATSIPASVGASIASQITAFPTLGTVGPFSYDGYSVFTADLTSSTPGAGSIMVAFDNNILCTNNLTVDPPVHTLQSINYNFVYTNLPGTGEPRRTPTDIADDKKGS